MLGQCLAAEMVRPIPAPTPAPTPAPNATRSGPWPSPHTSFQHGAAPTRAPAAAPIIVPKITGCRPAQLRSPCCCSAEDVGFVLAAGHNISFPNNRRGSIDDDIEGRIRVFAGSAEARTGDCAITVDGIINVNSSKPEIVLSIGRSLLVHEICPGSLIVVVTDGKSIPAAVGDGDADIGSLNGLVQGR